MSGRRKDLVVFTFGSLFVKHRVAKVAALVATTVIVGGAGLQFANAADFTPSTLSSSCTDAHRTTSIDGTSRAVWSCRVVTVLQPVIKTSLSATSDVPAPSALDGTSRLLVPGATTYGSLSTGFHNFTCQTEFTGLINPGFGSYTTNNAAGSGHWWIKTIDSPSIRTQASNGGPYWFPVSAIRGGTDGNALSNIPDCTSHSVPNSDSTDNSVNNDGNSDTGDGNSSSSDSSSSYSDTGDGGSNSDSGNNNTFSNISDNSNSGSACSSTRRTVVGDNGTATTNYPIAYSCNVFRSNAPVVIQPNSDAHQVGTIGTGDHTFVCQVQGGDNPTTSTNGTTNANTWWLAGKASNITDDSSNGWGFIPETYISQGQRGSDGAIPGIANCGNFSENVYRNN